MYIPLLLFRCPGSAGISLAVAPLRLAGHERTRSEAVRKAPTTRHFATRPRNRPGGEGLAARLCWHKTEGRKDVSFGETKCFKQRPLKGKRLWLQGTQKVECQAHVEVKLFTIYPGFAASKDEKEGLSMRRLWYLQEEQITSLKTELAKGQPVSILTRPIRRSPFRASNTHTHTHTHSLHMSDITPPTLYSHCPTFIVGYGNTKL